MNYPAYTLSRFELLQASWLWSQDYNTAEIAFHLALFQSDIVRRLDEIKAGARQIKARAA